ncbi:hypothetical protein F5888DRAFT_1732876 [Russula emetica]|nr:hypothetical protein F5888DRAFT_1732876 [Russula emetica]
MDVRPILWGLPGSVVVAFMLGALGSLARWVGWTGFTHLNGRTLISRRAVRSAAIGYTRRLYQRSGMDSDALMLRGSFALLALSPPSCFRDVSAIDLILLQGFASPDADFAGHKCRLQGLCS